MMTSSRCVQRLPCVVRPNDALLPTALVGSTMRAQFIGALQQKVALGRSQGFMYRMLILVLFAAATVRSAGGQAPTSGPCLRYEPDTVQLTGRLERHMYYGAPNYGEDPAHDEQEVGFYLGLAGSVCAAGGRDPALNNPRRGVRRVQLVLDSAGYAQLRPYLGQRVTLRGTLFASHTGHHHTPILLDVAKPVQMERARRRPAA